MKKFMDKDFLLTNETAKSLYHDYAEKMPVIDYHCHIDPKEIAEDRKFDNITQVWLGGDHYKWRLIRSNGVPEKDITGDSSDWDKFKRFADTLPKSIGNPMYHWTHLELQRYFGYDGVLNSDTAETVWNLCNEKLQSFSVRKMIEASNVETIVTTDDPVDNLCWHNLIRDDKSAHVKVLPAWRPDKVMNIEKPDFAEYVEKLASVSGMKINTVQNVFEALKNRMDYFDSLGCKASDHGLNYVMYYPSDEKTVEEIFKRGLAGEKLSQQETDQYKYALLMFLGREYSKRGWVMQLHYGVLRNSNSLSYKQLGQDKGFDCIGGNCNTDDIVRFMDALEITNQLPKTILYSANSNDNAALGTIIGCFQGADTAGKIQHGSAWWFNDTKSGMEQQLINLSNLSLLGNFIGMLTDSRSFLSYTRHEYFRRILCNLIGSWAENGEVPCNLSELGKIVRDISYFNVKNYFGV